MYLVSTWKVTTNAIAVNTVLVFEVSRIIFEPESEQLTFK